MVVAIQEVFPHTDALVEIWDIGAAAPARIVLTASEAHRGACIDFDDLQGDHRYNRWRAYRQSKLANLLLAFEIDRRSRAGGWGVACLAAPRRIAVLDPGERAQRELQPLVAWYENQGGKFELQATSR